MIWAYETRRISNSTIEVVATSGDRIVARAYALPIDANEEDQNEMAANIAWELEHGMMARRIAAITAESEA